MTFPAVSFRLQCRRVRRTTGAEHVRAVALELFEREVGLGERLIRRERPSTDPVSENTATVPTPPAKLLAATMRQTRPTTSGRLIGPPPLRLHRQLRRLSLRCRHERLERLLATRWATGGENVAVPTTRVDPVQVVARVDLRLGRGVGAPRRAESHSPPTASNESAAATATEIDSAVRSSNATYAT
ncbi:hypothetical protein D8S78_00305 [Natrialba swarupiae]|nr:hypothetical protein [Natrialba swarupiae]